MKGGEALYIDSEELLHDFLKRALGEKGIPSESIVDVYTPEEAVDHLMNLSDEAPLPRLILYRCGYKEEESISFLQQVRAEESRFKDIPLFLIADNLSLRLRTVARELGVDHIFP